jgi:branched-chain amino acid transport system substrate-binding protein
MKIGSFALHSRRLARGCAIGLTLSALAATSAWADVVKIGVLVQLTGASSADGEEIVRGAKMAIEDANAKGGVAGHTFELAIGDTKDGAAGDVAAAVERLLSDQNVHFIAAGYASLTSFELDNMKEAGMPYILSGPSGQTRGIISPDPSSYWCCWSLNPSFDAYNTDVPSYVDRLGSEGLVNLGGKKVALISSDNAYSNTIHDGMKEKFQKTGWTITVDEVVPFGEVNDWRTVLTKVRQNPPDLVVNLDYLPKNAARFMDQFMESPTKSLMFMQYAPSVPEFVNLTGDKSQGVIYNLLGGVLNTPKNPRATELQSRFKAKYGTESGTYGIGLYEEINLYFDALAKVGDPTKHEAIGKAIGETDKVVAEGRLKFDPKTHLAMQGDDFLPIQFYQIQNKQRVLIAPKAYATGEFQLPPFGKK